MVRSLYRYDPLGRRLVKQVEHYSIQNNQLHETAEAKVEFYGWDGDRLAFTQSEENQWHVIYEPESFTPLLQLQQPTDTPISEQDKVLAEVMGSLQSTLDYLPVHEAYELSRSVREQTIAQLKANQQWQTPQLPEECYFYHCNHLSLPEALTNQKGEAVWAASYDAWGNVKEERNPNHLHQPIRLPGQYHDKETNLYYNRHRYYDPKLGNYISQDPIGLASGEPNLMAYPRNPVQRVDPLGLLILNPATGAGIGTVAAGPPGFAVGLLLGTAALAVTSVWAAWKIYTATSRADELSGDHKAAGRDRTKAGYGGNCTPDDYDALMDKQRKFCKEATLLKRSDDTEVNQIKEAAWDRCAQALEDVMNQCFDGGNKGHKIAAEQARNVAIDCTRIIIK